MGLSTPRNYSRSLMKAYLNAHKSWRATRFKIPRRTELWSRTSWSWKRSRMDLKVCKLLLLIPSPLENRCATKLKAHCFLQNVSLFLRGVVLTNQYNRINIINKIIFFVSDWDSKFETNQTSPRGRGYWIFILVCSDEWFSVFYRNLS